MKYLITLSLCLFATFAVVAQSDITKANTCFTNKEYQCALDNYLLALTNKGYAEADKALVEYRIGYCYLQLVNDNKALEYFHKSAVSKPDYMYAYWGLGDTYFNLKKDKDAVEYYEKAYSLATLPADKESIGYLIAETYYGMKQYNNALTEYKKIVSRTGEFVDVDAYLGDAYYNLAKYDSAVIYYLKAIQLYPAGDPLLKKINFFTGKSYRLLGKNEIAEKYLNDAIALDAKYGSAYWEKGILYANKEDYTAAIDLYKKALATFTPADTSDNYTLCGNLSACYRQLKNYTEEMNWMQKRKNYSKNKYSEITAIAVIQYARLKKNNDAEKTCVDGINAYQIEPETLRKTAELNYVKLNAIAGKIVLEKKDTTKAEQYFSEALKLNKYSYDANAGAAEIAWNRKDKNACKTYFTNITKSGYDTVLNTKKEIANVYGRSAHINAYVTGLSTSYYSSDVETALRFDSLQKEAVLLWPIVLSNYKYDLERNRTACLSVLNKAIMVYAADKEYISDLYNSKAVVTLQTDTAAVRKALEEGVKIFPANTNVWNNLLKFYGSYDNAKGAVMVEKLIDVLKKKKDNVTLSVAYVYKGDFLWRQNKKDEAKTAYQEALVWNANNATAKDRAKLQ